MPMTKTSESCILIVLSGRSIVRIHLPTKLIVHLHQASSNLHHSACLKPTDGQIQLHARCRCDGLIVDCQLSLGVLIEFCPRPWKVARPEVNRFALPWLAENLAPHSILELFPIVKPGNHTLNTIANNGKSINFNDFLDWFLAKFTGAAREKAGREKSDHFCFAPGILSLFVRFVLVLFRWLPSKNIRFPDTMNGMNGWTRRIFCVLMGLMAFLLAICHNQVCQLSVLSSVVWVWRALRVEPVERKHLPRWSEWTLLLANTRICHRMSRGNSIGGVGGIGWQEVMAPEAKFVCSLVR